jgi:GPI ethanolamine phosphate transferase 1
VASIGITASSVISLQAREGLPILNQISGWAVLGNQFYLFNVAIMLRSIQVVASLYPFLSRVKHHTSFSKLLMFFLGFGPCFVILSISVEGLFYISFSATLALWIEVEAMLRPSTTHADGPGRRTTKSYIFQAADLRIALFFLFFVQTAFFGTGK